MASLRVLQIRHICLSMFSRCSILVDFLFYFCENSVCFRKQQIGLFVDIQGLAPGLTAFYLQHLLVQGGVITSKVKSIHRPSMHWIRVFFFLNMAQFLWCLRETLQYFLRFYCRCLFSGISRWWSVCVVANCTASICVYLLDFSFFSSSAWHFLDPLL